MPIKMPKPDMFGNFWFGPKRGIGPAVFAVKEKRGEAWVATGYWYVSLGESGMVWQGANLKRYKYLQEAIDVLEELA